MSRRRRRGLTALGLGIGLAFAPGTLPRAVAAPRKPAPAAKPEAHKPEAAAYLDELEKRGLVDKTLGTPQRLAEEVRLADESLVRGELAQAAARLYAVVEAPRYQDLAETDDFQDAEYRLGLAMSRGGGTDTARRYFLRVLQRGSSGPFYLAALRGYVDVCLEARTLGACVSELDRIGAEDKNEEIAYLRGRAAFEGQVQEDAEGELSRVSPKSRFYSSALYLRGVLRVRKRDFKGANDAFCQIADVKDGDTIRFYIDGRYYALRDLARIALGRLAHEEKRFDDAFYHYFLIPQDSPRLGEALFEAAWSSLQRKEYDLGARLAEAYLKEFPESPRAAEARLLFSTLQVKTCRFADAEKGFDTFLREHEPLLAAIDRALADPAARQELAVRLLDREARAQADLKRRQDEENSKAGKPVAAPKPAPPTDPQAPPPQPKALEERLTELLELDPRFFRLAALSRGLQGDSTFAAFTADSWRALEARVAGTQVAPGAAPGTLPPAELSRAVRELGAEVEKTRAALRRAKGAPEAKAIADELAALESRRQQLAERVSHALGEGGAAEPLVAAQGLAGLAHAEAEHAGEMRLRTARLQQKIERASGQLLEKALTDLRGRMEDLLRRARLGKIDAVVGQKRRLEKQIEDLAAGRFPPEMFGRLHLEGLIGDDEEYWPPEQEVWLDEYENYK